MDLVTISNMYTKVFENLKEVLDTNTNGYEVSPTYSKNASIPIITVDANKRPGQKTFEKGKTIWTVDINAIHGTYKGASTLAQEIETLILAAEDDFDANNMILVNEPILNTNQLNRGKGRAHVKTLTYQFLVIEQ